jgi:hypothetical protein
LAGPGRGNEEPGSAAHRSAARGRQRFDDASDAESVFDLDHRELDVYHDVGFRFDIVDDDVHDARLRAARGLADAANGPEHR